MKLYLSMLKQMLDLPTAEIGEIRTHLDEAGLEVKAIETTEAKDTVFTIETLANRADHGCALGAARELSARLLIPLRTVSIATDLPEKGVSIPVRNDTALCTRYALLEMSASGEMAPRSEVLVPGGAQQGRHPLVAVSNYVLMELGQPTHVFDRDKIQGEIVVTATTQEETITALDGNSYRVPSGSVVIRDRSRIVAVAGVIGCSNSMVTPETRRVLVESATFDPVAIRKTARAMGLSTDASHLFERGTDTEQVVFALKRLVYLARGASGVVKDASSAHPLGLTVVPPGQREVRKITLPYQRVRDEMNLPRLNETEVTSRLKYLGYTLDPASNSKQAVVVVPSWRLWDVSHEQDVVEDVVRSIGLHRVKIELPLREPVMPERSPREEVIGHMRTPLHGNGFHEVITKGFYTPTDIAPLEELSPGYLEQHVRISNAIDRSNALLKGTNILHIAGLLEHNLRHGSTSVKCYEVARLFSKERHAHSPFEFEREVLSIGVGGRWYTEEWGREDSIEDRLLHVKGVLLAIGRGLFVIPQIVKSRHSWLHPGYQGELKIGSTRVGAFGLIHPDIKAAHKYRFDHIVGEFDLHLLMKVMKEFSAKQVANTPSIRRDITLAIPTREWSSVVVHSIEGMKLEFLTAVQPVDLFLKEGEDVRRVTYRLTFQHPDRALAHDEVDGWMASVITHLQEQAKVSLAG
jgi:phenylalanyl-tRNA synthetase beta chain